MSKKKVTAPTTYNPGSGHPKEYLAYLNWQEMEALRRLNGNGPRRGPKGIPSFADDSASSLGNERQPESAYSGYQGGGDGGFSGNSYSDAGGESGGGGYGGGDYGGGDYGGNSYNDVGGVQSSPSYQSQSPTYSSLSAPATQNISESNDESVQRTVEANNNAEAAKTPALSDDSRRPSYSYPSYRSPSDSYISGAISRLSSQVYGNVVPTSPGAGGGLGSLDTRRSSLLSPVGPSSGIEALGNIGPTRMPTSLASKIQDRLPSYATPVSPLEREPRVMPPPSPTWTPNVMTSDPFGESFGRRMRDVTAQDVFIGGGLLPTVRPYTPTTIPQSVTPDLRISPASGQPYGMRSPLSRATGQPYGMKIIGDIPAPPIMTAGEVGMSFRGFAPSELAAKSTDVRKDIGEVLRDGSRLGSLADGTKLSVGIGPPPDTTLSGPLSPVGLPANTLRPEPSLYRPDSIGTINQAIGSAYRAIGDYFSSPEQPVPSGKMQDRILGAPEDEKAFLTVSEIRDGVPTYFKSPGGLLAYPGLDKVLAPDLPKQSGQEKILKIEDVPPIPEGGIVDLRRPQKFTSYPRPSVVEVSSEPSISPSQDDVYPASQETILEVETVPPEVPTEVYGPIYVDPEIQKIMRDQEKKNRTMARLGRFGLSTFGGPVGGIASLGLAGANKLTKLFTGSDLLSKATEAKRALLQAHSPEERERIIAEHPELIGFERTIGRDVSPEDAAAYQAYRENAGIIPRGMPVPGTGGSIYQGGTPIKELGGKNPWWEQQRISARAPYEPDRYASTTGSPSKDTTALEDKYLLWDNGIGIPSPGDPDYNEYQKYLKIRDQEGTA